MILSGGGASNLFFVEKLKEKLPDSTIILPIESFGMTKESREAISFAVLGYMTLKQRKGNIKAATGAKRRVILGKISFPG